jgi:hypothetical protein
MTRDESIEQLFDVLTSSSCTTQEEIATRAHWSTAKVKLVLAQIRRPAVADEWGWTVPHVSRGRSEHEYRVVLTEDPQSIPLDEMLGHLWGAVSTLAAIGTEGANEAHALQAVGQHVPRFRNFLRNVARAFDGASAMAENARELVLDELGKNGA